MRPKTRKHRAAELWARLRIGPEFYSMGSAFTPEAGTSQYRGWALSWILRDVALLVPELKDKLDMLGNVKDET